MRPLPNTSHSLVSSGRSHLYVLYLYSVLSVVCCLSKTSDASLTTLMSCCVSLAEKMEYSHDVWRPRRGGRQMCRRVDNRT